MKLNNTSSDAFCPVCALAGTMALLHMSYNSLSIECVMGHTFDTLELSKLASVYEPKTTIGQ